MSIGRADGVNVPAIQTTQFARPGQDGQQAGHQAGQMAHAASQSGSAPNQAFQPRQTGGQTAQDANQQQNSTNKTVAQGGQNSQSTSRDGVAGQGRRDGDGQQTGTRDREALLSQAMDLLKDLAAIDPQRVTELKDHVGKGREEQEASAEPAESLDDLTDPGQLFGRFAKSLQQAQGQLAWGKARHLAIDEDLLERLRRAPGKVHEAAAWWYRRTLARGQAEAQLQELKCYVRWLCDRGQGLQILLDMSAAHGRAVGTLLAEVDVLQRIVRDAVKRASIARASEPVHLFDRRREGSEYKLSEHSEAGRRAERAARIMEHLDEQLFGSNDNGMDSSPPLVSGRGDVGDELQGLLEQLRLFRPVVTGERLSAETHSDNFECIIADIRSIIEFLHVDARLQARWRQLEAMGCLLLVRLQSAASWVDGASLAAIQDDVIEALELAVAASRANSALADDNAGAAGEHAGARPMVRLAGGIGD